MRPTAVVMNMYYTGLGIARSLGERGVPVIGLTAQRRAYGKFTRYAKPVFCPDSRNQPEALLARLLELGQQLGHRAVLFPTRDDDVVFLDRFREDLAPHFILAIPPNSALRVCLSKWETYLLASKVGVATPRSWLVDSQERLRGVVGEVTYPCVLKPVSAHHWRKGDNWAIVRGRKAIKISSRTDLLAEYSTISAADRRVLVQEMVPGGDDCLVIAACYLDRNAKWVAGFNTQKLAQSPEGFGTGCIVQTADRPELFETSRRLLDAIGYQGVAEVEYKWHSAKEEYQLVEINPRLWDQHRLGKACGTDLAVLAYDDHAGLEVTAQAPHFSQCKWIAEDAFALSILQFVWRRDPKWRSWFRLARGRRIYAIWSARDPLPFVAYMATSFVPGLFRQGVRLLWSALKKVVYKRADPLEKGRVHENQFEDEKVQS